MSIFICCQIRITKNLIQAENVIKEGIEETIRKMLVVEQEMIIMMMKKKRITVVSVIILKEILEN